MLAKESKMANILKQREYIKKQLLAPRKDGNPSYVYVGQVFPENIEYFEREGFTITKAHSDQLSVKTLGNPLYLFTVSDKIMLSDEEMEEAENLNPEDISHDNIVSELLMESLMDSIF